MEFRLIYEGPLLAQGAKAAHKWEIRRAIHPQLARLWQEKPLVASAARLLDTSQPRNGESIIVERDGLRFAPLVSQRLNLYAEISVLMMRQQEQGALFSEGGDIDNRLKTLLDGLRLPRGPNEGRQAEPGAPEPDPFFCLLEDDALITRVSVETTRLLRPAPPEHVLAIVGVHVKKTMLTYANMSL